MENQKKVFSTKVLIEASIMIAAGTVLSMFKIDMPFGGGITICSMLPLVFFSYRRGIAAGLGASFAYSLIQMMLGLDNIQYATGFGMALAITLSDYVIAYTVIGLSGIFKGKFKNNKAEIALGTAMTLFIRFICHFFSGWLIWDALWPNEYSLAAPVYSLVYNGCYMLPEIVFTSITAMIIVKWADYKK